MSEVMNWLLEDNNPAVKYRTQTELFGQVGDKQSAFAEFGISYEEIPKEAIEKAFAIFDKGVDCGCADFDRIIWMK